jgi:XTP/dITP diphosphohydrolase
MKIFYVTRNEHKMAEFADYLNEFKIKEKYNLELQIKEHPLQEILHPDINVIVKAKALEAYKYMGVPCVVEHGGIFINSLSELPGGIGQIIWDAVGDRMCSFIKESDSRSATACSIIGYCDGKRIRTFRGETKGQITRAAIGDYKFNWDPIFIPEGSSQTYGEMGLQKKRETSQAIKAWNNFLSSFDPRSKT